MSSLRSKSQRPAPGFTLLELMITVVVVSILAALAYPSFMDSIRKSRRSDAVAALTRVQHAQERFRANVATYSGGFDPTGADATKLRLSNSSPDGHYTLALSNNAITGYTVTATANAGSPQSADALCQVFTVVQDDPNGLVAYKSTNASAVVNSSSNNPCWVK